MEDILSRDETEPVTHVAPGALPIVGHLLRLGRDPLAFLESLYEFGDVVRIRLGSGDAFVVCHPRAANQLLLEPRAFDKGGPFFDQVRVLFGDGLATCGYEPHRRQRRLMQPAFHKDQMTRYAAIMAAEAAEEVSSWRDGELIDVTERMMSITTRVVTRTMFATEATGSAVQQIRNSISTFVSGMWWRAFDTKGLVSSLPTAANRRYSRALRQLHEAVNDIVATYRASGRDRGDLLSMLLAAREEDGSGGLSDDEVHDQVMTLLVSGIETTATTLAWAMNLLDRHPDVAARLRAEADGVLENGRVKWEDLPDLTVARNIALETMRMYPSGWVYTRITSNAAKLSGHSVPSGAIVIYSPYLLHHHPESFAQPHCFDPDRWTVRHETTLPKGTYVPFSAGVRKCIGDQFAIALTVMTMATVAANCRLTHTSDAVVRPRPRIVLRPGPLVMRVARRTAVNRAG